MLISNTDFYVVEWIWVSSAPQHLEMWQARWWPRFLPLALTSRQSSTRTCLSPFGMSEVEKGIHGNTPVSKICQGNSRNILNMWGRHVLKYLKIKGMFFLPSQYFHQTLWHGFQLSALQNTNISLCSLHFEDDFPNFFQVGYVFSFPGPGTFIFRRPGQDPSFVAPLLSGNQWVPWLNKCRSPGWRKRHVMVDSQKLTRLAVAKMPLIPRNLWKNEEFSARNSWFIA